MQTVDVGLHFWLTEWNWQPSIIIGTIGIVAAYLYAIGPLRTKYFPHEKVETWQIVSFISGVVFIFLALFSALDKLGDRYLFSAHMVQHLFLTLVGPPLIVLGFPGWLLRPILRKPYMLKIAKFLVHPATAFVLYNVDFWLWHAPSLYNLTLVNDNVHILEHLSFIIFGVIYWWPVFSQSKELPPLSIGGQVLYVFLSGMPMVALGAGLTFANPLYAPYIAAPRVWGLSPATDQQLGGLIMWVPAGILNIVIISVLFIKWMMQQDARQRAEEATLYDVEDEEIVEA